ncbi:helix-turn-helix domain-containing protein [Halomarina rubra]|uniref:Helix-turn-helix domain-containing protein n=1 Tax=Halomarina rubra TaxID=2071873 RepID=A0ABD6AVL0_9EURY|nr:helix-turn-helix domain-containing protein [Halomarina rubra]
MRPNTTGDRSAEPSPTTTEASHGAAESRTVAELRFEATDLALGPSFERHADLRVRVERVAASRPGAPLTFAWVGGVADPTEALSADPTVSLRSVLADRSDESLCELGYGDHVSLVVDVVASRSGTVLAAMARNGEWSLRVRYPSRERLADSVETLARFDVEAELAQIGGRSGSPVGDLTDKQRETVATAYERGYFEIPRRVSLEELAEELDVTHQALSERLRRAEQVLLRDEFGDR